MAVTASPAFALDPRKPLGECNLEMWHARDGLTGTIIRFITQTPDGLLWIGGYGGVARYDGGHITRLDLEPPNEVGGLAPGPDDTLLVGPTRGQTACMRKSSRITCAWAPAEVPNNARLNSLFSDAAGNVLMGTESGLYRFTGGRLAAEWRAPAAPFASVTAVLVDAAGQVWVGAYNGLFVDRGQGFVVVRTSAGAIDATVRGLHAGRDGRIWALTDTTLVRIGGDETATFPLDASVRPERNSQVIEDRDGNVWIGGSAGLSRFRDGRFITFTRSDGLPDDEVTAVFEDREGSLWVGTGNGALAQFSDRTLTTTAGPPSLRDHSIESVCEDPDGVMWFGSYRGLTRWKDGVEKTFTVADGLPEQQVYAIHPAHDGGLWVGTHAGLVHWRDGRVDAPVRFHREVYSLYLDRAGSLWIGTDTGLARLDGERVSDVPTAGSVATGQVRGIRQDDQGVTWVTSAGGLFVLRDGALHSAQNELGGVAGHADRGLFADDDGTLWFGAATSLVRRRKGELRAFTDAQGLTHDWLFQVMTDDLGCLWIATSRAILRVTKASIEAVERGERDRVDLVSFETSDRRREVAARRSRSPGVWKGHDGRLWFATLAGVVTIDPHHIRTNPLPPPVIIEDALVDGRPAEPGATNVFPPGHGTLEVHFAGVTLVESQKARHRYRLEGFDEGWVDAGARRVAYYTNLPPGRYRFHVQATNADGVWNAVGATLDLRLRPHFYQTPWFYALCGLGVAAAGLALYRARLRQLRLQYLAVFAERSRLARELHDSLLQGMSAVALELENVRAELPAEASPAARRLEAVENALTESLEETRRFVWNLREQPSGEGDLGLALGRLAGRLVDARPIEHSVRVEGSAVHLARETQGSLFRVAQEALTNALKHAEARAIRVRLAYEERTVTLTIADDGRGFVPADAPGTEQGHFGLVGMRERARKLGGTLTVDSRPGQGTTISLTIPTAGKKKERHV
jgi:signal transduction histidine kinase/ligand-binding sensor domain-containing protein